MPNCNDPNNVILYPVEESIWGNNKLTIWQFGKLRNRTPESGYSKSLFKDFSALWRNQVAPEGLSRRIYEMAERNCTLAVGVKRIFNIHHRIAESPLRLKHFQDHNHPLPQFLFRPSVTDGEFAVPCPLAHTTLH